MGITIPHSVHEKDMIEEISKAVIVTIHGQESKGKNLQSLSAKLASEMGHDCEFVNLRYTRLLTIVNTLPWVRTMTAKYIASRLETIGLKWPQSKVIVIAHSNGTVALGRALVNRDNPKKKWPVFGIHGLVLLGCPMKRKFDWNKFSEISVINFISKNDNVVFLARAYGMGAAGRYGFKKKVPSLKQVCVKWGHSGFMQGYSLIRNAVKLLTNPKNPFEYE